MPNAGGVNWCVSSIHTLRTSLQAHRDVTVPIRLQKCDGEKPTCAMCIKTERECRYQKPSTKPMAVVLQERVDKLERKLQKLTLGQAPDAPSPSDSTTSSSARSAGAYWAAARLLAADGRDTGAHTFHNP